MRDFSMAFADSSHYPFLQLAGLKPTRYGLEAWTKVPKYMAKGYALHSQRRKWQRFEAWHDHVETAQSPAIVRTVQDPAPKMRFIPEPPRVKLCNDAPERVVPVEDSQTKALLKQKSQNQTTASGNRQFRMLVDGYSRDIWCETSTYTQRLRQGRYGSTMGI